MRCDLEHSVPDWLIEHPETAPVFAEFGIDTSCGGKSLRYLCQQGRLDPDHVHERLLRALGGETRPPPNDAAGERS